MFDLIEVKQRANLLYLTNQDTHLNKVASSGNGEWAGPCPFCGGHDRFRVQPYQHRWLCRGCTDGKWKSVIDYLARRHNLDAHKRVDLEEICRLAIGETPVSISEPHYHPIEPTAKATTKPSITWQKKALGFINACEKALWIPTYRNALDYLHNRGLEDSTIKAWHLGFNPTESFEPLSDWGLDEPGDGARHTVWLPAGIIIPCIVNREVWYVKIRRLESEPKYINIKGGHPALFGAEQLMNSEVAVLTEGEFDTMLLWQEAGDIIGVATLGSSTNIPDMNTWGATFSSPHLLMAAYDVDIAGRNGAKALMANLDSVIPLEVPVLQVGNKDITDFFLSGGDLRAWMTDEVGELIET